MNSTSILNQKTNDTSISTSIFLTTTGSTSSTNDAILWSTIASILYFSSYALLVIILSIYIHKNEQHKNKKEFLKAVWTRKGIYGQILVHLYDTATDIGVLIEWGTLAYDDNDYNSIDMYIMFWTSIGFLIFYRLVSVIFSIVVEDDDNNYVWYEPQFYAKVNVWKSMCLGFWDMYIIKTVYESLKYHHEEPTPQQKAIQLMESIFESLPQVRCMLPFCARIRISNF